MKIALDPFMLRHVPLTKLPAVVAELGYEYIELSPREDFTPFFLHPRANTERVREFRAALAAAGVQVASHLPLYRWSGPDEDERQAAVRYWKRAIELTVDLGCDVMNSEFNGRPVAPSASEAQFWRSLEELLPIFEREGIQLRIEPHPDDFVEDGRRLLRPYGVVGEPLHHQPGRVDGPGASAPRHRPGRGRLGRVLRHAGPDRVRRHRDRLRLRLGGTRPRVVCRQPGEGAAVRG